MLKIHMNLFNKSFFRFTMGFIGILIVSFVFAFVVSELGIESKTAAVEHVPEASSDSQQD